MRLTKQLSSCHSRRGPYYKAVWKWRPWAIVVTLTICTFVLFPSSLQRMEDSSPLPFHSGLKRMENSSLLLSSWTLTDPNIADGDVLKALEPLGVERYQVVRNAPALPFTERLPVVMLVHHREFYAGCHTFERFFNPKWETVVVVAEDMAEQFRLMELATQSGSPAVHFALLNSTFMTGEWLGRRVFFKLWDQQRSRDMPPLVLSAHCDIHPLPEWHAMHKPFDQIVTRMVHEFLEEDRLSRLGRSNVNDVKHAWNISPLNRKVCEKVTRNAYRPLFAMNVAMLETIPSTKTLDGSIFHARQVGLSRSWWWRHSRPFGLAKDKPWMSDVSTWLEDHLVLYDSRLLESIVDDMAKVHNTISAGVKALPSYMCKHTWKAVRLNDEPMFYDVAKSQLRAKGHNGKEVALFDPSKYGTVSLDWLFTRGILDLADINSPLGCLREYMRFRTRTDSHVMISCVVPRAHFQLNHVPESVWDNPIGDNERIVQALMQLHGYDLAQKTNGVLEFVSTPSFHTYPLSSFAQNLKKGIDGVIYRSGENGLDYISLPQSSSVKPEAFFNGNRMRRPRRLGNWETGYAKSAAGVCHLLESPTWHTGTPISARAAVKTLAPVADNCPANFDWAKRAQW